MIGDIDDILFVETPGPADEVITTDDPAYTQYLVWLLHSKDGPSFLKQTMIRRRVWTVPENLH